MSDTTQSRTVLVVALTPVHMGVDYHQVGGGPTTIEVYYADPIDTSREPDRLVDGYIVSDSTGEIRGVVSEGAGGEWDYQVVRRPRDDGAYKTADGLTMLAAACAHPRYLLRSAMWGSAPTRDKCLANVGMVVLP